MRQVVFENAPSWCRKHHINKRALKQTLKKISADTGFHVEHMSYVIVSDQELLEINRAYLQHDYFTDIITFDFNDKPMNINGEAYLSKDTIQKNALHYGIPVAQEFARVVIHGFLHLSGFNDKTPTQRKAMRAQEEQYLSYLEQIEKTTQQ